MSHSNSKFQSDVRLTVNIFLLLCRVVNFSHSHESVWKIKKKPIEFLGLWSRVATSTPTQTQVLKIQRFRLQLLRIFKPTPVLITLINNEINENFIENQTGIANRTYSPNKIWRNIIRLCLTIFEKFKVHVLLGTPASPRIELAKPFSSTFCRSVFYTLTTEIIIAECDSLKDSKFCENLTETTNATTVKKLKK